MSEEGADRPGAAFAVARIRLARRADWASHLTPALVYLLALVALPAPLGLIALLDGHKLPEGMVLLIFPVMMFYIAALPALLFALPLLSLVLLMELLGLLKLPLWLPLYLQERQAESLLLREGRIPEEWYQGRWFRTRALQRLLRLDAELIREPGGVRTLGSLALRCPSCGAPLRQPGPGLRSCDRCGYDRYEPIPPTSPTFQKARIQGPDTLPTLFRAYSPRYPSLLRWGGLGVALSLGSGLLSSLLVSLLGTDSTLAILPMALGSIATLPSVIAVGWCSWVACSITTREWPKLARYRAALKDEVLRITGERGAVGFDELASQLSLSRGRLEAEVGTLLATRELPLYHDRDGDRLISSFCEGVDSRCPACGGQTAPDPGGSPAPPVTPSRCRSRTSAPRRPPSKPWRSSIPRRSRRSPPPPCAWRWTGPGSGWARP